MPLLKINTVCGVLLHTVDKLSPFIPSPTSSAPLRPPLPNHLKTIYDPQLVMVAIN